MSLLLLLQNILVGVYTLQLNKRLSRAMSAQLVWH